MSEVGYAGGTWDLLHYGHIEFLRHCKDRCDYLVVSVNRDQFVERYKRKPIMTTRERIDAMQGVKYADLVIVNFGNEDSRPPVRMTKAKTVFYGSDYTPGKIMAQMGFTAPWLKAHGIEMQQIPYTPGISTTEIIERCCASR